MFSFSRIERPAYLFYNNGMAEVSSPGREIGSGGFLDPERIVRQLGLERGDHVADFGAGHGYFTIPMARLVGGDGRVYAIDIQKAVLDIIRAKAKLENILNIEPVWADLDSPGGSHLKDKFIDFVMIANILFQAEKPDVLLREAYRVLREGGRMAIIEWSDATPSPFGPPPHLRVKKEVARQMAMDAGLEPEREFETGGHHYGLLFKKR